MGDKAEPRIGTRVYQAVIVVLVVAVAALAVHHATSDHGDATVAFDPAALAPTTDPVVIPATTADIGFLQDMSDHHAQAVLMSSHLLRQGTDLRVRNLAFNILADQAFERGTMAALLRDRGAGPGDPDREAMAWMGHGVPVEEMPGLIPSEEVAELLNLTGTELDRRYLELMLVHHEGGVEMATTAIMLVSDPAIRDLAGRMRVAQETEVTDIQTMLG